MTYTGSVMSDQELHERAGKLMFEEKRLAAELTGLRREAAEIGRTASEVGAALQHDPELVVANGQSRPAGMRVVLYSGWPTDDRLRDLTDRIRNTQAAHAEAKRALKGMGLGNDN